MTTPRSTAAFLIAALLSSSALAAPQQQQVAERDREAICDDVRNGYVSAEAAASQYGFKND